MTLIGRSCHLRDYHDLLAECLDVKSLGVIAGQLLPAMTTTWPVRPVGFEMDGMFVNLRDDLHEVEEPQLATGAAGNECQRYTRLEHQFPVLRQIAVSFGNDR